MTVEEIEIIVTAKVEEALKEFIKIAPAIREQLKQAQEAFSKVDMQEFNNKVKQSMALVRKQVDNLKKSSKNNEIKLKVNNKEAQKQINQISKSIKSLKNKQNNGIDVKSFKDLEEAGKLDISVIEQINNIVQKMGNTIKGYSKELRQFSGSINFRNLQNQMQQVGTIAEETEEKIKKIGSVKYDNKSIQDYIEAYNKNMDLHPRMKMSDKMQLSKQEIGNQDFYMKAHINTLEARREIKSFRGSVENEKYQVELQWKGNTIHTLDFKPLVEQLRIAKQYLSDFKQKLSETLTTQNKLSSFFGAFKQKIEQIKPSISNMKNSFSQMPKITQNITNNIKGIGSGLKQGLGHILKYATTLLSLKGIYSTLRNCANTWLSSQNASAKQLSTNIDYMKYAMGSALAPVIQFVTNLVYQLMKAIQSVAYALTGVNIFAKATASNYSSMAKGAKKAKEETKQLAGVHDEINNISDNKDANNGSGVGTPSFDLSGIDNQMSPLAQKLYDFFKPLKESWEKYGSSLIDQVKITAGQVGGLISAVWGSFEKIITNGTVYTTLKLILAIIGNIAEALANAWNYNGNGDAIVQNLANAFNNLLTAINNVVQSDGFQNWLNNCSNKFREITEKLAEIDWEPLVNALARIGETIGTMALEILNGLVYCLKWLSEHPEVAEFIGQIAVAFLAVHIASSILSPIIQTVLGIFKGLHTIISIIGPIINQVLIPAITSISAPVLIIVGVIAGLIATFVHLYNSNEEFRNKVNDTWKNIVELFQNYVMPVIEEIKTLITNVLKTIWSVLKQIWSVIEPFIQEIFENIMDWWNTTGSDIVKTLGDLMRKFMQFVNQIWQNVISPIIDFLVQRLKPVIGIVMGAISGAINAVLSVITTVWNTIKGIFNGIINFVTGIFAGDWRRAWEGISSIFSSIVEGLGNIFKVPINFIIDCINGFIGGLNKVKIPDWVPAVGGKGINIPKIPRLAKGGVLYDDTIVRAGEYSGASSNPEIVTPQNIMRETMEDVMSDYAGNNGQPLRVTIQYLGKEIFDDTIDYINSKTRRTGKNTIVTVGD